MPEDTSDPTTRDATRSRRAKRREAERQERRKAQQAREERAEERERSNHRLILGGVVAVVVIAVGFIAFGWYQTQIKPLSKTVLRVEEYKYDLGHLERRMDLELERSSSFFLQSQQNLLLLPQVVVDQLTAEAVLLSSGDSFNLTVTDEDVAAEVRFRGALADDVEADVYAEVLRSQVEESGLRRSEYERMLRASVMEDKVRDYFRFLAPLEEDQIRATIIQVSSQEDADRALQLLQEGEDFTTVAVMVDASPAALDLDWFARGGSPQVVPDVEDFLFDAEIGDRSEIIQQFGFFFIAELLEREDNRPLDDEQRQRVAERDLDAWAQAQREELDIVEDLTQEDIGIAFEDIL